MSSFETCWCLNYKKVSLHVSFLLMLSFGAKPISCIWCSTETRPVCERNLQANSMLKEASKYMTLDFILFIEIVFKNKMNPNFPA